MRALITEAKKQFPYTLNDLRRDNPCTSFSKNPGEDFWERWSVYKVDNVESPSKKDNEVYEDYDIIPDHDTKTARVVRKIRNMTDEEKEKYRQMEERKAKDEAKQKAIKDAREYLAGNPSGANSIAKRLEYIEKILELA